MTLGGYFLVPKTQEHDRICNATCREVNLYGKWPVQSWAEFIHHVLVVHRVPGFQFPSRTVL